MDPEQGLIEITEGPKSRRRNKKEKCKAKGPLRVARLCLLAIFLPCMLLAVPLYLRYRVYSQHLVPLGMSDMRLIDGKISTTWCQRQLVTSNATFNAYLLAQKPAYQKSPKFVHFTREIVLEDDMKEYWGFYLLKGSTVTISSCARRPGASLIVIRGHHHLRQCAYIGDDSSEEEAENEEKRKETETNNEEKKYSNKKMLQKVRPEVQFLSNKTLLEEDLIQKKLDTDDDEYDMKLLKDLMKLREGKGLSKTEISLQSGEIFKAVIDKLKSYENQGKNVVEEVKKKLGAHRDNENWLKAFITENQEVEISRKNFEDSPEENLTTNRTRRHIKIVQTKREELNAHDEDGNNAEEQGIEHEEVRGTVNGTTANDTSNSEFWSSFSSSEERLMECDGLIISQPLTPSALCHKMASAEELHLASSQHSISYTVPGNGYYFFVFSSENEIQPNFIHAEFALEKMLYDVSKPVATCENSTGECALPLNFFSHESLVLELPINDSLWNDEFLVVSTCEPRTTIYVICVISVPLLILFFAF